MEKTFLQALDELEEIYKRIIELMPYQNDTETSRELRELRIKANKIENTEINY